MPRFNGLDVTLSLALTVPGAPVTVHHTWPERLFGRGAWRPGGDAATTTVVPQLPSREVYKAGGRLFMHPVLWAELQETLRRQAGAHAERWR